MTTKISTIFFGTHNFAREVLQALVESEQIRIDLVITKPDRKVGREQKLQETPIKKFANKHKLPVRQPKDLDHLELTKEVDLGVVSEFGKIIPQQLIDYPKHGILLTHQSLLPKYRGPTPIQQALIEGETETGVSIIKMKPGVDTGPIVLQRQQEISDKDKHMDLRRKLSKLAAEALLEAIPKYVSGEINPQKQDDKKATMTEKITKDKGEIDWNNTTETIYNKYKAFHHWPGIWTTWDGKRLKLNEITKAKNKDLPAGKVEIKDDNIFIGTVDGAITVKEIQLEGKQSMKAIDFINGYGNRLNDSTLGN